MLGGVISRVRNAFQRVFVRATVYSVLGMLAFTLTLIFVNYYSQASKIETRLESFARDKADTIAASVALDIPWLRSKRVETILNTIAADPVIAAKAYTLAGREFASDWKTFNAPSAITIEPLAVRAAETGVAQIKNAEQSMVYVAPAISNGRVVGSVLIRVSKRELHALLKEFEIQSAVTLLLVFAVFVPVIAVLMHRATAGLSEIAETAKVASEGFLDLDVNLSRLAPGEVGQLQTVFKKLMTTTRQSVAEIRRHVFTDRITGLPNRTQLEKALADRVGGKKGADGVVFYIGLDRFKLINDMHGYRVGDMVLTHLAERLSEITGACAERYAAADPFVSRFSGDEFVVILSGAFSDDQIAEISDELVEKMGRSFRIEQHLFTISVSIGVVQFANREQTSTEVLQNANLAMYRAKSAGRGRPVFYTPALRAEVVEKEFLESRLSHALENNSLEVHYQPKVDILTEKISGAEALLRWNDPELGSVSPLKFIPAAEETGLIVPIGEFVLQKALEDIGATRELGFDISVAVNVSPLQLQSPSFTDRMLGIIGESGFPTQKLELEITESSLVDYTQAIIDKITPIRNEGVKFAIDDFGTGYSCLNSLTNLPFNTLKIDRSFIRDLATNEDRRKITELILLMARQLNMETVSEGIETELQADYIKVWGGRYGQGFLWSKPMPIAEFRELLARERMAELQADRLPGKSVNGIS